MNVRNRPECLFCERVFRRSTCEARSAFKTFFVSQTSSFQTGKHRRLFGSRRGARAGGVVSTRRRRIFMLVPCRGGLLREKPTAAAVRAAAPYFFALRERRRQAKPDRRLSSPAPRSSSGRVRSGRLRDRLRAVSYRLLRASRLSGSMASPTSPMTRRLSLSLR